MPLNGLNFWERKPEYSYRPVDSSKKEIRVIDVLPGSGRDKICCSLRKISLLADPLPEYET